MLKRVEKVPVLAGIIQGMRSQGKVVVLAAGHFEPLTPQDIRFLEDASSRGDYLIVGLSKNWRKAKSGGGGLSIADRAIVLSSLRWVDYAVTFDGETAGKLLDDLKPSIYAHNIKEGNMVPEQEKLDQLKIGLLLCGGAKIAAHASGKTKKSKSPPAKPMPKKKPLAKAAARKHR